MKAFSVVILYFFCFSCFALNATQEQRLNRLSKEIRCVVCQGQSIADSNAPIAHDMRRKVSMLIEQQKTDQQIRNYLSSRYGDFVLLRPKINKTTWLLWGFPFIATLIAALFLLKRRSPDMLK